MMKIQNVRYVMDRIDEWLNTASNQKYTHMITLRFKDKEGTQSAIFCKSLEERREKVIKIQEIGMIMGKYPVYIDGVYVT